MKQFKNILYISEPSVEQESAAVMTCIFCANAPAQYG